MEIIPIDDHITAIDHHLLGLPGVGVTFVVRGDTIGLIETGTSLTVSATLAGLEQLGIHRDAVEHIICTHVHMDHSGGAGYLANVLPRSTVYIHSLSMELLVDPTRLMISARRAVGEAAWALTGDMLPIPRKRLQPAEELHLDLGSDAIIDAIPSPGHSPDHVVFWDRRSGGVFLGDAAGLSMPHYNLEFPVTPVPSYDLVQHRNTIQMLLNKQFSRLYITHWGVHDDVDAKLNGSRDKLDELVEIVNDTMDDENPDVSALAARWINYPSDGPAALVATSWSEMSVAGLLRYAKQQRQRQQQ